MAGHSFGGMTALLAAMEERRIKATLAMDPWFKPVSQSEVFKALKMPTSKPF